MKLVPIFLAISSLFAQANLTNDTLIALQQLRTVIPERQWEQEFSILVDFSAFEEQAKKIIEKREGMRQPCFAIAQSKDYFLNATMSGETIRILDGYQEFEEGIFWRTPRMLEQLYWMEEK